VGPRYLTVDKIKYYFFICKDAFDQAVYVEFHAGNAAELVLSFLIAAWQHLGLPQQVQFDNGRQFYAPGRYARSPNRVIRLALRLGVQPVFIPEGQPARNGSVENFNGWFQPLLLRQNLPSASTVQRQVRRLITAANEQHVHQALGFKTPVQCRRMRRSRIPPANFVIDLNKIPVSMGKIMFIRLSE
jgi:transposase InsO family protein